MRDVNLSTLLEDALEERGNTIAVIAKPTDGEDAVIRVANSPFARIMGWPAGGKSGMRISELRPLVQRAEDWASLISALRTLSSLSLDLMLRVNGREAWLGFNLTFKPKVGEDPALGILIGRDITEIRERRLRETETQHLLAAVFLRVSAAMAIVGGDGAILMANPACQRLIGYPPAEIVGLNVEALTAPEFADAARTVRARQLLDAGDYVMRMDTVTKTGTRVPLTLHSVLLRDARDRRLRVVTLIPDAAPNDCPVSGMRAGSRDAEGLRTKVVSEEPLESPATRPVRTPDWLDDEPPLSEADAKALLRRLRAGAGTDVRAVTGRDGVARPIVVIDFLPAVRGRLYDLAPSLPHETDLGTSFDLIRLDLAILELVAQNEEASILLPVSWPLLADADYRSLFDERLGRLKPNERAHLMVGVTGVPRSLGAKDWCHVMGRLRHQIGEAGLWLTHRDGDVEACRHAIISDWPLSLLVIDRTQGPPVDFEEYHSLIAAARRREISVLVRTTAEGDLRDWRNLGTTMFVAAA
jgi:PAS domain S-box-containing protein